MTSNTIVAVFLLVALCHSVSAWRWAPADKLELRPGERVVSMDYFGVETAVCQATSFAKVSQTDQTRSIIGR